MNNCYNLPGAHLYPSLSLAVLGAASGARKEKVGTMKSLNL